MNYSLYAFIGLGGALGAIARYALSTWITQKYLHAFPWGTFAVNIIGCFLLGIIYTLGTENPVINSDTRLFLSVGFVGAFTTFSTFSLEIFQVIRSGDIRIASFYVLGSLCIGLLALWLGISVSQLFVK